jgi:hypothetical protein
MRDTRVEAGHGRGGPEGLPLGPPPQRPGGFRRLATGPIFRIILYYIAVIAVAVFLVRTYPLVERALITPSVPVIAEGEALIRGQSPPPGAIGSVLPVASERALTTLLVVLGAVSLALPVAWVYMITKPLRFDPGLVRSIVILPIAVAGILLVVKHSLAIAFSLAGIVAAVRFRNTLKDPRDAVYIFLTIAIGIAAGVQALDVALVVSLSFNAAVYVLWRFHVGSLQTGPYGRTGVISLGDRSLFVGAQPEVCERLRSQAFEAADGLKPDGILLVHTTRPEVMQHAVLEALRQNADDWRTMKSIERGAGVITARYVLELAKKSEPADLLGALDEWSSSIEGAEFIPFHRRRRKESDPSDEDNDDE